MIPILLFFFWLYLAYRAFARGDMQTALVFLCIGVALTIWRLRGTFKMATKVGQGKRLSPEEALVLQQARQQAAVPPAPPPATVPAAPRYLVRNGQQEGPFPPEYVLAEIAAGRLSLADWGWREGMAEWVPLSSLMK